MIIGIDGNEANVEHKVGVSVYTHNLLRYFQAHSTSIIQFVVYLRSTPRADLPPETEFFKYRVVWGPMLWSQLFLPLTLWIYKLSGKTLSVFFSPAHYIPRFCPFKTVVTIHDLSYLFFKSEFLKKDLYQLINWTRYAIEKSSKIIAVSKTTKKDLMHEYSTPENKIEVVYNGYEHGETRATSHQPLVTDFPYFLYLGTIQPRKNLALLISAFTKFHTTHPSYKLIIAGKKGWLYETIFDLVHQLRMEKNIQFSGFVSDDEKMSLYKGATAFVLPSLYEGFGIPLLEAMSSGCPVVSSFSSSLPEIGAEACLYFDPKNEEDLVEKLEEISSNIELRNKLIMLGKTRSLSFSWEKTGEQTLRILQSL